MRVTESVALQLGDDLVGSGAESAHPIFFSLDNEPDLWPDTHPRIHPDATTYAELAAKSRPQRAIM